LLKEVLRESGSPQNRGDTNPQFLQLKSKAAGNPEMFIHPTYSDLSDAMSIENRYLTSALSSLW
jgi:hypothetical protein